MKKVSGASNEDLEDCIKKFNDKTRHEREDIPAKAVLYLLILILCLALNVLEMGVRLLNYLLLWPWFLPFPSFGEDRFNTLVNTEIHRI